MFEVRLTPQAENSYRKLDKVVRGRIDAVFLRFQSGEFTSNNITALRGKLKGYVRYRMGDWRIVFSVDRRASVVWIASITTRGGAYR